MKLSGTAIGLSYQECVAELIYGLHKSYWIEKENCLTFA